MRATRALTTNTDVGSSRQNRGNAARWTNDQPDRTSHLKLYEVCICMYIHSLRRYTMSGAPSASMDRSNCFHNTLAESIVPRCTFQRRAPRSVYRAILIWTLNRTLLKIPSDVIAPLVVRHGSKFRCNVFIN